jgi:adenylylsulfate kinase-like enzyme
MSDTNSLEPGTVIWITGLSGAGKSTVGKKLVEEIKSRSHSVVYLDGDELREVFGSIANSKDNHGREGRLKLSFQYAFLCKLLSNQGISVVIATISMFKEIYTWNRENLKKHYEIFLDVPIIELKRRDPKEIYKKFDRGEITSVAGLDLSIDQPVEPHLHIIHGPSNTIDTTVDEILKLIYEEKL